MKIKKFSSSSKFSTKKSSKGTGLSSFWRGPWSSYGQEKNDDPRITDAKGELADVDSALMAKHLRAIRGTCHLVFNRKAIDLRWATQDESFTDIKHGKIRLSPKPLLTTDETYDDWTVDQRLDVIHGLALHEAAHNKWTPADAKTDCAIEGGDIFAQLFNLMEDVYIENEVAWDYPGFAGYFESKNDYYFTKEGMEERVHKLVEARMDNIGSLKGVDKSTPEYKELVEEHMNMFLDVFNVMIPYVHNREVDLDPLRNKGGNWERAADILDNAQENADMLRQPDLPFSDRVAVTREVFLQLASLFHDIPKEELEKQSMNDMFGEMEKSGLGDKLREMMAGNGVDDASGKVGKITEEDHKKAQEAEAAGGNPKHAREDILSREKDSEVNGLIEADLREIKLERFERGSRGELIDKVQVIDMKPLPYANIRYNELSKKVRGPERRLMNVLKFRAEDRIYKERERDHGRIDGTRLHNLKAFGSSDIFYQNIKAEAPKVHVGILVDESGSMRSGTDGMWDYGVRKMDTAVETTILMANALSKTHGTTYEVWGHSGDCGSHYDITSLDRECNGPIKGTMFRGTVVMRYLDPKNGLNDLRVLGRIAGRGNNYDGLAVEVVGNHMAENAPNDRKVMFVICDGMPSGYGYGGHSGCVDVQRRVKKLAKKNVEVISIFVGDIGAAREQMNMMYGKENTGWIHCKDAAMLPKVVEKIAAKLLKWDGAA